MFDGYLEPKAKGSILLMAAFILIPATYQASIYSVNKKKKKKSQIQSTGKDHFHTDYSFH